MEDKSTKNTKPGAMQDKESVKNQKRAPTALTVDCGVCLGPAPDHLHFGARCCYSCRAFFRRNASCSNPLTCRSSLGTCEISRKSKKCISCRYDKCLQIGMDPQLVQGRRMKLKKINPEEEEVEHEPQGDEVLVHDYSVTPTKSKRSTSDELQTFGSHENKHPSKMCHSLPTQEIYKNTVSNDYQDLNLSESRHNNIYEFAQQIPLYKGRYNLQQKEKYPSTKEVVMQNPLTSPYTSAFNQFPFFPQYSEQHEIHPFRTAQDHVPDNRMATPELFQNYNFKPQNPPDMYSDNVYQKEAYKTICDSHTDESYIKDNQPTDPQEHFKTKLPIHEHVYPRQSVIKRVFNTKRDDPEQLQFDADMLKFQGSLLQHTGNLFSYHANLLERDRKHGEEKIENLLTSDIKTEESIYLKTEIKKEYFPSNMETFQLKESESPRRDFSETLASQMFVEAQELLINCPWITNIVPSEHEEEMRLKTKNPGDNDTNKNGMLRPINVDIDNITDLQFSSEELATDMSDIHNFTRPEPSARTSVIHSHELAFQIKK